MKLIRRRRAETWRNHSNPDGSIGGKVSSEATVAENSFIASSAVVLSGGVVDAGQRIESGTIVTKYGAVNFGKVRSI